MPEPNEKSYINKTSYQVPLRVPFPIHSWLSDLAYSKRKENPESRAGVATEINAIIKTAYEKAVKRQKREPKRV